jgi:hypothetical protein
MRQVEWFFRRTNVFSADLYRSIWHRLRVRRPALSQHLDGATEQMHRAEREAHA